MCECCMPWLPVIVMKNIFKSFELSKTLVHRYKHIVFVVIEQHTYTDFIFMVVIMHAIVPLQLYSFY